MKKNRDLPDQLAFNFGDSTEIERLKNEINRLREENAKLLMENERLKRTGKIEGSASFSPETNVFSDMESKRENDGRPTKVTKQSSIEEKIALFRNYFKGREDVYAVRGSDQKGKAFYFTKRQYLGKENGKAIWGENLPLTDEVIKDHLQNENRPVTIGIYPLLLDETCWFLAMDFDKTCWKEDAAAFLATCRSLGVPAALERSRSGNGGHVWIFFEEPVSARMVRRMGSALLTMTLEKRHQIGLDSYDRLFPNQDTLPKEKKLGNLIALPFQRLPGKEGNSLFVDENYEPYKDQWAFLGSLRKMKLSEIEAIVREAERKGEIIRIARAVTEDEESESEPWNLPARKAQQLEGKLPQNMN